MSELLSAAPPRPERVRERPLTPARRVLVVASATLLLLSFYAWAVLLLAGIAVALFLGLFVVIGAARMGLADRALAWLKQLGREAMLVLRCLGIRKGTDYRIALERRDAPGLYALVERIAARLGTAPPDQTFLIPGANAYVQLRGLRSGRGRTMMAVGYDLFAGLTQAQLAAVIAHEIAHARLIQRGVQGWLHRGNVRVHQLAAGLRAIAAELDEIPENQRTALNRLRTAERLSRVPAWLGERLRRRMAEYSRQHEFLADALSAQACGTAVTRSALVRTHVLAELGEPLDWRARTVRLEREGSFAAWLAERLTPASPAEAARLEARALEEGWEDGAFDTHPALRDRVDALPAASVAPAEGDGASALRLLAAPDPLALKLVSGLEAIAEAESLQDAEAHVRRMRRKVRGENDRRRSSFLPLGLVLFLLPVAAVLSDSAAAEDPFIWGLGIFAVLCIVVGALPARLLVPRDHAPLPAPPAKAWTEATEAHDSIVGQAEGWVERKEAELAAASPPPKRRAARARHWAEACYRALARCDYAAAFAAARLCLQADGNKLEGKIGAAVAGAFLGSEQAWQYMGEAINASGVGPSTSWAAGWTAVLIGDSPTAEAFLLDAVERRPADAVAWWVLADAQRRQGKLLDARRSAARAVKLDAKEPRYRLLLVNILLEAGRARTAAAELPQLEALDPANVEVMLAGVWAHVLLGHDDEAAARADRAAAAAPGAETELRLAATFLQGDDSDAAWARAELHFARAAEHGFHPQRLLGEAEVARKRGDFALARARCLAALDLSREWAEGSTPLPEVFSGACRGLMALAEPERCRAWQVVLEFREGLVPFRRMHLLLAHRDAESAARLAAEVRDSLHPGAAGPLPAVTLAPQDQQPTGGPLAPGVYQFRFE